MCVIIWVFFFVAFYLFPTGSWMHGSTEYQRILQDVQRFYYISTFDLQDESQWPLMISQSTSINGIQVLAYLGR